MPTAKKAAKKPARKACKKSGMRHAFKSAKKTIIPRKKGNKRINSKEKSDDN